MERTGLRRAGVSLGLPCLMKRQDEEGESYKSSEVQENRRHQVFSVAEDGPEGRGLQGTGRGLQGTDREPREGCDLEWGRGLERVRDVGSSGYSKGLITNLHPCWSRSRSESPSAMTSTGQDSSTRQRKSRHNPQSSHQDSSATLVRLQSGPDEGGGKASQPCPDSDLSL